MAEELDRFESDFTEAQFRELAMPPRDRIRRAIEGRATRQHRLYDDILERTGRPNVGVEEST
jgi:hypothetical protein